MDKRKERALEKLVKFIWGKMSIFPRIQNTERRHRAQNHLAFLHCSSRRISTFCSVCLVNMTFAVLTFLLTLAAGRRAVLFSPRLEVD